MFLSIAKTFCRCTEYQDIDSGEIVGYRDNDASCQRFYEYVAAECLLRTAKIFDEISLFFMIFRLNFISFR